METPYYETFQEISSHGIRLAYSTAPGGYHPLHWHDEIELLYQLNGEATIQIDGQRYHIPKKHLTVIDSRQVHSTYTYSDTSMFICIHISRQYMERYLPDMNLYRIHCIPDELSDRQFTEYRAVCQMLEHLTRLYIENATAFFMETEGLILQIFAHLIRYFSVRSASPVTSADSMNVHRIQQIISYVEAHFREPLSLDAISGHLGLTKEYFCRFFKKNMGMSFLRYVNEVRISHIYQDLIRTDSPIYEIAETNGFQNQKLFNRTFRQIYGCTPSSIRKKRL